MVNFFFYGTLCHLPLLAVVLGRQVAGEPAVLPGHAVHWADGHVFPLIVVAPGGQAAGLLVRGLTPDDVARLDFYEGGFAFHTADLAVQAAGQDVPARVYLPDPGHWQPGAAWSLTDWQARWGDIVLATARDFMALHGQRPPAAVLARYEQMLVRGSSRVRAADVSPATLRHRAGPDDVQVAAYRQAYANFFAVEEYDLAFRRFGGGFSPVVTRAVFVSGDAVTVLPYDPVRDRVLLVEQFRPGAMARGDTQPWVLEPIAGRIDPGETPEQAARREAVEEAGLTLGALLPVANYYPSPGGKSEFLYSYVALADLPDGITGVFGVAGEAEDIRGHLVDFADLVALIASGEAANAPLILTALWLQRERERLRAG
ncbi:NUDIX domain-containing protein [Fertoebacter nigrum]|uniref:ADP-ribose pyrophosphatase n=1 Tax=Fertoeibacter niger TaxID=2656921 RepID=A0A8X8GVK1_9RHOB|nr:NUDIX domain-containing protein [Fertoeibacter niger]NUB45159.1 NUDIX domain-containing protein [Fertoeibacter niger]